MEPTAEMRWWWPGRRPEPVVAWFSRLPGAIEEERRTDHYLHLPGHVACGIKARAGDLLDVKVRLECEPEVDAGGGVVGDLERWTKWQFPLASHGPGTSDLDGGARSWLRASKVRWLVEVGDCELELAEVDIAGTTSWSLAAEGHGDGDVGRRHVLDGLRWMVDQGLPADLVLTADRSHGYPAEMLAALARGAGEDG